MSMKQIFVIVMLMISICQIDAQNVKRPELYNYQCGLEAMQEEKFDEAIDYFNKDIQENPMNGYSYSWIAHIRLVKEKYGKNFTAVDLAIKNQSGLIRIHQDQ